jgi:uncharacterized protein YydD (DUF2326 family)
MEVKTFSTVSRIVSLRNPYMIAQKSFPGLFLLSALLIMAACGERQQSPQTQFTKADSLTETYLSIQDSLVEAWNMIITDDNHKIEAMHNLVHELMVGRSTDIELLKSYETRLNSVTNARYTLKTMANPDVIEEYDFASNALVTELISLAESQRQFAYNTTLQKLVDNIRIADQRVIELRNIYDQIAQRYNKFVEQNHDFLNEMHSDTFYDKRPLFQMASE